MTGNTTKYFQKKILSYLVGITILGAAIPSYSQQKDYQTDCFRPAHKLTIEKKIIGGKTKALASIDGKLVSEFEITFPSQKNETQIIYNSGGNPLSYKDNQVQIFFSEKLKCHEGNTTYGSFDDKKPAYDAITVLIGHMERLKALKENPKPESKILQPFNIMDEMFVLKNADACTDERESR